MADIKKRNVVRGTIKTLDRSISSSGRIKDAYSKTKQRAAGNKGGGEESPEVFAESRVMSSSERAFYKTASFADKRGKAAARNTAKNIISGRQRIYAGKKRVIGAKLTSAGQKQQAKAGVRFAKGAATKARGRAAAFKNAAVFTFRAVRALMAATKTLISLLIAGGWVAVTILLIVIIFGSAIAFFGNTETDDYTPVSEKVESYEPLIRDYAKKYGILEYTELIKAIMMAESRGEGIDPMGAGGLSPESSIDKGCLKLSEALKKAEAENPIDIANITKALSLYNGQKDYAVRVLKYYPFRSPAISPGDGKIVSVALSQVGNKGGKPYWSWYGFNNRVHWCACFVSWCADKCGYIDEGVVPKFSVCSSGVNWFKAKGRWKGRSYTPKGGDIIFFDWSADGTIDHVGIVEKCQSGKVYTIEGNSGDACRKRVYPIGFREIYGYGLI